MSVESFIPIPVEVFGSLVTFADAADVPIGLSPDNQDIEYTPGGFRTRPGIATNLYAQLSSGITGLKSFIDQTLTQNLLVSEDGSLLQDIGMVGVLTTLVTTLTSGAYMNSTTLFSQEWMGFSDGKVGIDMPRRWDNSAPVGGVYNVDRASQYGPGGPPTVADSATAGSIPAGIHAAGVMFVTRSGFITNMSPFTSWTAVGSKKVAVTAIPIGPSNVVARLLCFSGVLTGAPPAVTGEMFATAAMLIQDNVTTTATIDFSATQLTAGQNVTALSTQQTIPYSAGVTGYADRTVWWGAENIMPFWNNLDFSGGFNGNVPLGWTAGASQAGGLADNTDGPTPAAYCYKIQGDGATATRGQITQTAVTDQYFGANLIEGQNAYTVRAKIMKSAGLAQGRINIHLSGTGINTTGIQLTQAQVTTGWVDYSATLTTAISPLPPANLVLEIFADQTPTNGQSFFVTEIRILPSSEIYAYGTVLLSGAEDPEALQSTTGLILAGSGDGQAVRCCFELRNFLYIVKERSLWVTQDNGNEPSDPTTPWSVDRVDAKVGTPSVRGVGLGEGFAIVAGRSGAYYFDGGTPQKLTQEIQPTWDSINWKFGHTIIVQVNTQKQQVKIAAPFGNATTPNKMLMLDYTQGWSDPYMLTITGTLVAAPQSRKWTIWNVQTNAMGLIEQTTGAAIEYVGYGANAGVQKGYIFAFTPGTYNDLGNPINGYYTTAYLKPPAMGGGTVKGRCLFGYFTANVYGAGTLLVSALKTGGTQQKVAAVGKVGFTLTNPASKDVQGALNMISERAALRIGTNDDTNEDGGDWMQLTAVNLFAKADPFSPVWGKN